MNDNIGQAEQQWFLLLTGCVREAQGQAVIIIHRDTFKRQPAAVIEIKPELAVIIDTVGQRDGFSAGR